MYDMVISIRKELDEEDFSSCIKIDCKIRVWILADRSARYLDLSGSDYFSCPSALSLPHQGNV